MVKLYFIDHAQKELTEDNVPLSKVKEMLQKSIIIEHPEKPDGRICIYKEKSKYYTIITQPTKAGIFIITGYCSKEWEKRMYKERQK